MEKLFGKLSKGVIERKYFSQTYDIHHEVLTDSSIKYKTLLALIIQKFYSGPVVIAVNMMIGD